MKHLLSNRLLTLIFSTSLIVGACSKEDEGNITPQGSDLEEVSLSLAAESGNNAIEIPVGMRNSTNEKAQEAVVYVEMVNQIGAYFTFFTPPSGAEKSSQPITVSNARTAASNKEYLVYKWTYQDLTVAYQLSEEDDKYVWEIFWKEGSGDFQKYLYAEESKTKKQGLMKIYGILGFEGNGDILYMFSWDKKENGALTMTVSLPTENFYYTVNVNPDASGDVEYVINNNKVYTMTWTSKGNGTWVYYEDGKKSLEGTWEAA